MKIKIITGFRKDQEYTIDGEESHKAYYLFLNPSARGVFSTGVALTGKDIKAIEPDYQSTMGWNPQHQLDEDDWNEIKTKGVDRELRELLNHAKQNAIKELIGKPLSEAKKLTDGSY